MGRYLRLYANFLRFSFGRAMQFRLGSAHEGDRPFEFLPARGVGLQQIAIAFFISDSLGMGRLGGRYCWSFG